MPYIQPVVVCRNKIRHFGQSIYNRLYVGHPIGPVKDLPWTFGLQGSLVMKTYNPSEEPSFMLPVDDADVAKMVRDTERRMARKLKKKVVKTSTVPFDLGCDFTSMAA